MSEEKNGRDGEYSKRIRAGKRTYFFDVKATRSGEKFVTITESIKKMENDQPVFQKHKIFLYKEDFQKFSDALTETLHHIESSTEEEPKPSDNLSWD